ncbi:uncharacterized protein [Oscarella lobularis]|uniref:uncharacterized protein n=1 Tax=Oscarella lobularis TaxID=121494 RepID=UPI0033137545
MSELPRVLVTGASGYIGSNVVAALLAEKKYRVRGTVRDATNETRTKPLRDTFPEIELFSADLNKDDGWKEAVAGCTYVHHTASPFPSRLPSHPDELIRPAVDGTRRVLEACVEAGTVKRVVMTSSIATMSTGFVGNEGKPRGHVYTKEDWTDPEWSRCPPYEAGKTYAEKMAREFVEKLEGEKKFEFVTIHPAGVFGPIIFEPSTSLGLLAVLMKSEFPSVPDLMIPFTDVRDVSKAHVAAMTKGVSGERYILWTDTLSMRAFARILADEFNPQGYRVPLRNMWKTTLWFAQLVDSRVKMAYSWIRSYVKYENSQTKEDLGVEPTTAKESAIDTAYSLIEHQVVPKMAGFKGRENKD